MVNVLNEMAIAYESEAQLLQAQKLAKELQLPINNQASQQLLVKANQLVLQLKGFKPFFADFNLARWQKRRDAGKKQGLVRACKPGKGIKIIDATAGLGRDAAILASFGAEVVMLERHPILVALLADALNLRDDHSKMQMNIQLYAIDAFNYLNQLIDLPDVIYIDPMHPPRQKAALVKKEMQVLQQLIPRDERTLELITLAQQKVKKRVVVKWPEHQQPLCKPSMTIPGKTVRFDIYLPC